MRLDVAVRDTILMAEVDGRHKLLKVPTCGCFFKFAHLPDLREKIASRGKLHDEVDFGFRSHNFVDLENVWVVLEAVHG